MTDSWPEPMDEVPTEKYVTHLHSGQWDEGAVPEAGVVQAVTPRTDALQTERIVAQTYWTTRQPE